MHFLFLDAAAGVCAIAVIAAMATHGSRRTSRSLHNVGWVLVAGPLPLAVGLHKLRDLPSAWDQALFLTAVAAFAIGAALVLRFDAGDDGWRDEQLDDSPPWWPEFERAFKTYVRQSRSRRPPSRV
jgi:hypothetical protein